MGKKKKKKNKKNKKSSAPQARGRGSNSDRRSFTRGMLQSINNMTVMRATPRDAFVVATVTGRCDGDPIDVANPDIAAAAAAAADPVVAPAAAGGPWDEEEEVEPVPATTDLRAAATTGGEATETETADV